MRIVVHDYSGHPFQFQLSAELSWRGHQVLHLYSTDFPTPKAIGGKAGASYAIEGLTLGQTFHKYAYLKRRLLDVAYGRLAVERIRAFAPDVILSANAPLDAQSIIMAGCRGIPFVYWLQDFYSIAIGHLIGRKWLGAGALIAAHYRRLERAMLRRSDAVVVISDDFAAICARWGVGQCHIVENWAPIDEVRPRSKNNPWSHEQGLHGKRVLLYAGTLGLKHDPAMLLHLAERLADRPDTRLVVVSEGLGADRLKEERSARALERLIVLPFQSYERLSEVFGTSDVLLAILNDEAGIFSVPSKILSYLAAGKPIVLAASAGNLAARTVEKARAGIVVPPGDPEALARAALDLLDDNRRRMELGRNARSYAEAAFDIRVIGDRFEAILAPAHNPNARSPGSNSATTAS